MIALSIGAVEGYKSQLQLPWWGVLFAAALAAFFTLPIEVIAATTNQVPGLNIITEYIIGYVYPGRPVANVCFKTYGYISMAQAVTFLQDFKLGHYMKIPPRAMFAAQLVGTAEAALVYLGTAWWLLTTIKDICNTEKLPANSPWTCPSDHVFFDASVIWGLVGPRRIFGSGGLYKQINWWFGEGALAPIPVWVATKIWPNVSWIRAINMPILIGSTGIMPPATAINFSMWILVGFIFNYVIFHRKKAWWSRYNYVLSASLDAGLAFMGVAIYFVLGLENKAPGGEQISTISTWPHAPHSQDLGSSKQRIQLAQSLEKAHSLICRCPYFMKYSRGVGSLYRPCLQYLLCPLLSLGCSPWIEPTNESTRNSNLQLEVSLVVIDHGPGCT